MKSRERVLAIDASTPRMGKGVPNLPVEVVTLMRLMRVATQSIGSYVEELLSPINFSETTFHTLMVLYASKGGAASPGALSNLVGQTRPNMTRILDILVERDYVNRAAQKHDGRRKTVKITKKGIDLVRKELPGLTPSLSKCMEGLSRQDMETLNKLVRKVVLSMEAAEHDLRSKMR